jgi:tRNA (adenine22-N1)-methyltransferase
MELGNRLKLIVQKIPKCITLADIGTDHAYIPIHAVKNRLCERAIASDIKKGPVKIADRNIRSHGLAEKVETRLGKGLEKIQPNELDVVVIAGMGGNLIQEILENDMDKAQKTTLLILQPMTAVDVLRKWLYENGFDIIDEALAEEEEKMYNVICAKWTGKAIFLEHFDYYIGKEIIKSSDPLLAKYLQKKLNLITKIINGKNKALTKQNDLQQLISIRDRILELVNKG